MLSNCKKSAENPSENGEVRPSVSEAPPKISAPRDNFRDEVKVVFGGRIIDLDKVRDCARRIGAERSISYGEAMNELSLHVGEGDPGHRVRWLRNWIADAIVSDAKENVVKILGELPSGDLRRDCIAQIRNKQISPSDLKEYYDGMPDSGDRRTIGKLYVCQTYYDSGMDVAIQRLGELSNDKEREGAVMEMGGQMSAISRSDPNKISVEEIEKLRQYGKSIGMRDANMAVLNRINRRN